MIRIAWKRTGIPGAPGLSDLLRGVFPALIAPCTCRVLDLILDEATTSGRVGRGAALAAPAAPGLRNVRREAKSIRAGLPVILGGHDRAPGPSPGAGVMRASAYTKQMEAQKTPAGDHAHYDRLADKKPASLSVNGDLLKKAGELGIDLSATLEEALAMEVSMRQRELWLEENREAIQTYNEHVAQYGVFSAGLRDF